MDVLLLGYGAIGTYVARQLKQDRRIRRVVVLCRPGRRDHVLRTLGPNIELLESLADADNRFSVAVECAGHQALQEHGPILLASGVNLIAASTGALADAALAARLHDAAASGNTQLELVSGAVGAIDALAAARIGGLSRVVYRGRKPPAGWRGSPADGVLDLNALTEAAVHFSGTAREAALQYPRNANVASTVALAGIGLDETEVELIADPGVSANIHEIEAEGQFGRLSFQIAGNALPDNPKSSALTAMSIVAAVRRRLDLVRL